MKKTPFAVAVLAVLVFVAGCMPDSSTPPVVSDGATLDRGKPKSPSHQVGKDLFMANCARCHHPHLEKNLTGPALYGMSDRAPSKDWIRRFIRNSRELIKSGDEYAVKIYEENNKAQMDAFKNLTDSEIDSIIVFIDDYRPASVTP
jgi:mono/diheme cytochrome c family protein